ncbi:MAG TPA: AAA family ATPase, partial [Candidatus Hydrogenedentes bacterium]|nr:AAA family ATPase [Candidatus Hydrogenedentota bacterium]
MYFKQIDLFGFKSFADRTHVRLEPGITCIVGPNGCGKSNILDALRWALGEQSAKSLRGVQMQDVIFNGSENRTALGMAEVSITFDNTDNRLPIDYSEVQVTRRLYRTGESEYLLNKSPCRLRDVQELFMDTGIGTNAYSLIGQGKIDLVLSSKPEDRRFLFEEAAGIIKYKSRKRVAMRKLDAAEQNLLRLNDIIAEVERQMRSLKRQVNAAVRYRELTDLLKALEVRAFWIKYAHLQQELMRLREQYAAAAETYARVMAENADAGTRNEELSLRMIEVERVMAARQESVQQLDAGMEKIERQIALLRQQIKFIEE